MKQKRNKNRKLTLFYVCVFTNILIFLPWSLNTLYKSFCYFKLPVCWRNYVDLSQKYEWRHDLLELEKKCIQDEVSENIRNELKSELYNSASEAVSGIYNIVSDINFVCDSLGLRNCTKEAELIKSEIEQVFTISDHR